MSSHDESSYWFYPFNVLYIWARDGEFTIKVWWDWIMGCSRERQTYWYWAGPEHGDQVHVLSTIMHTWCGYMVIHGINELFFLPAWTSASIWMPSKPPLATSPAARTSGKRWLSKMNNVSLKLPDVYWGRKRLKSSSSSASSEEWSFNYSGSMPWRWPGPSPWSGPQRSPG